MFVAYSRLCYRSQGPYWLETGGGGEVGQNVMWLHRQGSICFIYISVKMCLKSLDKCIFILFFLLLLNEVKYMINKKKREL